MTKSLTLAPVYALLVGTAILLLGNGLLLTLTPVRADLQNFGSLWIGAVGAAYSAGFIIGCYVCPPLVAGVGHIRVFAALAAAASAVPLIQAIILVPQAWVLLRAVIGFCIAGLYMVIESWLNETATRETRGTIFAAYMMVNLVAIAAGQYLMMIGDPARGELFSLVAILVAVALIPVALSRATTPVPPVSTRPHLFKLYRISAVGFVTCALVGIANGSFWSLGAVFARELGYGYIDIAAFISVAVLGGATSQWPLGKLSDAMADRRTLIAVIAAASALASLLLFFGVAFPKAAVFGAAFLFGAAVFSLYSLCVAHTNDHADPADFVEVSAGLLMVFGLGATVGPILASVIMEALGDRYLFAFLAAVLLGMAGYTYYRTRIRDAIPIEEREDFVLSTRTSPELYAFDPRAHGEGDGEEAEDAASGEAGAGPPEERPAAAESGEGEPETTASQPPGSAQR